MFCCLVERRTKERVPFPCETILDINIKNNLCFVVDEQCEGEVLFLSKEDN